MSKSKLWGLYLEKQRGVQRFVVRKGAERYPARKLQGLDETQLRGLVERLNADEIARRKATQAVAVKHTFLSPAMQEQYLADLLTMVPSDKGARQEYSYLKRYVWRYFIDELGLTYPLEWKKRERDWARYLLGKRAPKSAKTKRDIVIAANRFVAWLHEKRPEDTALVIFKPISKQHFIKIEANREHDGEIHETRYIENADWSKIQSALPAPIAPLVRLAHAYGLRRSEVLGLRLDDVKNAHLCVDRQLERIGKTMPTKGRMKRKTPHWLAKASECYAWIEEALATPMHPRTLALHWEEFMRKLGMAYTLHDLRHTFITKALRVAPHPRDVQLAVGHKNILTTMGYARDDRNLDDAPFKPAA